MAKMHTQSEKYSAKVPLLFRCDKCKEPFTQKIHLSQTSFDWTCPKCGFVHVSFLGLDTTIGLLLREKCRHELLQEKDYPMAIVFAAMAFESELSRLFGKWKEIECIMPGKIFDQDACERELRGFAAIDRKIDGVSQFLVSCGIDDFVKSRPPLHAHITANFKSIRVGHLPADFQQHLFRPRNSVLHWGDAKYSYEDAAKCFSIADLGLWILREMDLQRRAGLP